MDTLMPTPARASGYLPRVGEVVRDLAHRGIDGRPTEGVYMDTLGGQAYLRPAVGGCEWTTSPDSLKPLDAPRFVDVHPVHRQRRRVADSA